MNFLIAIFGSLMVAFRVWLTQVKLVDELTFRRLYLSRVVNFHTFMAMAFGFENIVFNAIVVSCWPVMILTTVWDYNFFANFKKRTYWKKNHGWLILERLTLHPPILIIGTWMYLQGLAVWFPRELSFFPAIVGMIFVYVPFFLMDKRWTEGYNWPQPLVMIVFMIGSTIVINIIVVFGIYHVDFIEIFSR